MSIITNIHLLKNRRTKIVATLGPASKDPEIIKQLIQAGVNVFRLNMSHGDHDFHKTTYHHIRNIADELEAPVAILADLCGPKIRTGKFREGQIYLEKNSRVTVTTRDIVGEPGLIPSQYVALSNDVKPKDHILLNDGALELVVDSVSGTEITCTVVYGGTLKNHKGINLPGVSVSAPSLTEKDREDAKFVLELGVDFLALSFVRRASDVSELKTLIQESGKSTAVIAKIEKPEALENAEAILNIADGIMVARGDLGVELSPEQVPVAQNQLIDLARSKFKPVIVATQMLESMVENARPTRAEVTDISHAVTQTADAVMLSAETATGAFPVEAVKMMDRITRQTEAYQWKSGSYDTLANTGLRAPITIWNAVSNVTAQLARDLMVRAVLVISQSGMSAATMSSARPSAPVVAITGHAHNCRRMALLWSVIPVLALDAGTMNPNDLARRVARELQIADTGEYVLLVRGFHSNPAKNNPSVTVLAV
ncbi:MAG: pyruvate kinase [Gammaproteobacteria bacterium]|nr:pyruvate kinase [Gammaproteobacteria bacterium]